MNGKVAFLDRLKYGKHRFYDGTESYAYPHTNPDGTVGGWVAESALVEPTCYIDSSAEVLEYAQVLGEAKVLSHASISGFAVVKDGAIVDEWAIVTDGALVEGDATICGLAKICGRSHIDYGLVHRDRVYDYLIQLKNKKIERPDDAKLGHS